MERCLDEIVGDRDVVGWTGVYVRCLIVGGKWVNE